METDTPAMDVETSPTETKDATKMVQLESCDEQIFEIEKEFAEKSITIKHLITDLGEDNDAAIPLPEVTGDIMSKVIEWMKVVTEDKKDDKEYEVDEEFENSYFDPSKVDQNTLFALILAANFLDLKSLLDRACKQVANKIKGKTPEEIRKTFNIKNDFTPEEEEAISKENEWANDL